MQYQYKSFMTCLLACAVAIGLTGCSKPDQPDQTSNQDKKEDKNSNQKDDQSGDKKQDNNSSGDNSSSNKTGQPTDNSQVFIQPAPPTPQQPTTGTAKSGTPNSAAAPEQGTNTVTGTHL